MWKIFRKKEYLDYNTYEKRIRFLEQLYFQQSVRKQSVRNSEFW